MKKTKFTVAQILSVLKEREAALSVTEICRKHGISEQTYHNGNKKYAAMTMDELKGLKDLELENTRLKRTYSHLSLEYCMWL